MGWAAGEMNVILYADNGRIAGRDNEWVQDAILVTVKMFCRMVLKKPSRRLRPWSARQVSSRGSGGSKRTSGGRKEKEKCLGKGRVFW